jgi:polysaccharide biosynthesis/export protein
VSWQPLQPGRRTRADQQTASEPYHIGVQDVLTITVWKGQELSGSVVVRPDGKITLPLAKEIKVVGLTPSQLQTLLTEQLKAFVSDPQVTVAVPGIGAEPPPDPCKFQLLTPARPHPELYRLYGRLLSPESRVQVR